MLLVIGDNYRPRAPVWADAVSWPSDPGWVNAAYYAHLSHPDPTSVNGNVAYCFDELDPAQYPEQTVTAMVTMANRTTVPSLICVGWTLTPAMKAVVSAIGNVPNVRFCQEFYCFGEDGAGGDEQINAALDWYQSYGLEKRLVPVYNVANRADFSKGYRPFATSPGLVAFWCKNLMARFKGLGVYDAAVWGSQYVAIDESVLPGRGRAVEAWSHSLSSVFYS